MERAQRFSFRVKASAAGGPQERQRGPRGGHEQAKLLGELRRVTLEAVQVVLAHSPLVVESPGLHSVTRPAVGEARLVARDDRVAGGGFELLRNGAAA